MSNHRMIPVDFSMADGTESDQIVLAIVSQTAARVDVMNFDSCEGAAELAAPAVAGKDLLAELAIGGLIKPQPRASLAK
jgi:hypothetical protein